METRTTREQLSLLAIALSRLVFLRVALVCYRSFGIRRTFRSRGAALESPARNWAWREILLTPVGTYVGHDDSFLFPGTVAVF